MVPALLVATVVLGGAVGQRGGELVWSVADRVGKGADRTFIATGTRKGTRYVFRARGQCWWAPLTLMTEQGPIVRERPNRIFGIDFRVTFGADEKRFMEVGEKEPLQTEVSFVADRDDVPVRIVDAWELPEQVSCAVDGIEVVAAPALD